MSLDLRHGLRKCKDYRTGFSSKISDDDLAFSRFLILGLVDFYFLICLYQNDHIDVVVLFLIAWQRSEATLKGKTHVE